MSNLSLTMSNTLNSTEYPIIAFYFVKRLNDAMSNEMKLACEATKEKFPDPDCIHIISESECISMPKAKMKTNKNIFIFDKFDMKDEAFNYVYTASTVYVLSPRSILTMFMEGIPTPSGIFHIHNFAMRDLIVCATNLTKEKKKEIQQLVKFMGGIYLNVLTDTCTHLISDTVRSIKYEMATKYNVKIMHPNWVTSVWDKTRKTNENILATEEMFDKHKLPIFYELFVATTGMKLPERNNIKALIEENGGHYEAVFTKKVDLLFMREDSIGSEKFKAARKLMKKCLSPDWIMDSLKNNYAMPFDEYELGTSNKPKASTPKKNPDMTAAPFLDNDCTNLSNISAMTTRSCRELNINETRCSTISSVSRKSPMSPLPEYKKVLSKISLPAAKKVGIVLDGFNFYFDGFTNDESLLLGKAVSILGGHSFDVLSDQVTHILIGNDDQNLFEKLNACDHEPTVLKVEWLVEVIEKKILVNEDEFKVSVPVKKKTIPEKPSPASKKAMESMRGVFKIPEPPKFGKAEENDEEDLELLQQFLEPPKVDSASEENSCVPFLTGKNVFVYGYSNPVFGGEVIRECESVGATLVDASFKGIVDYVITTSSILDQELKFDFKELKHIVNDEWLLNAIEAGKCVEIEFFHHPIIKMKEEEKILRDEIFVVSNYKSRGRQFVKELVENLGGTYTEILKRTDNAILITPNNEGKKFEHTKSWNCAALPVEWLLKCKDMKRRVDETPFLIGGTKASIKNIEEGNLSHVPSSQGSRYDDFDPPVENVDDDDDLENENVSTPIRTAVSKFKTKTTTPQTPNSPMPELNISRLVADFPTPQRELTKAVLLEYKTKNTESPRQKRVQALINTPATGKNNIVETISSPRPQLPEFMRTPPVDYGIRPGSSPNTQWFHKRKLDGLDSLYVERADSHKRQKSEEADPNPTPPFRHRRYDFYKERIPDYNSPDPRAETEDLLGCKRPCSVTNEASKFLNFDDDGNTQNQQPEATMNKDEKSKKETSSKVSIELRRSSSGDRKSLRIHKISLQDTEQENSHKETEGKPPESQMAVEWKDEADRNVLKKQDNSLLEIPPLDDSSESIPEYIFLLNGIQENEKKQIIDQINTLGGKIGNSTFTHLLSTKPNRSEKFLVAIASGKFVLHVDYIKESMKQGRFVDESKYEYGNERFLKTLMPKTSPGNDDKLYKAPFKWRNWITKEYEIRFCDGAFSGISFILVASRDKILQFTSVIKAGGGNVIDIDMKVPIKAAILKRHNVDICLYDSVQNLNKENIELLKKCKVKLSNINVINQYLMSETVPEPLNAQ
ncbi:CLUMA_CG001512, isoform A [Clunio marinus]|uniref:CLUMA_CG001512, isoform A n=1 Tax=Clunio marinus TaxID=568069 RepID=A0A1J1HJI7_9DIPT|nr:CLUMA_CG001512, isoform A [Clunio marinus]